jgi:hypothetical protein
MQENTKSLVKKTFRGLGILIGIAIGYILGSYTSPISIIPIILILLAALILVKLTKVPKCLIPALAIQFGHLCWILLSVILTKNTIAIIDIVLMLAGLFWLIVKPALGAVLFLTAYQVFSLVINLSTLFSVTFKTVEHRAILLILTLRVLAIIFMFVGLSVMKKLKGKMGSELFSA